MANAPLAAARPTRLAGAGRRADDRVPNRDRSVAAALRRRLGELGGAVEWGAEVTGAAQDDGGVTVTFDNGDGGETARAG
ncbi:hypothetical protein [Actinomadura napierensis]